MSLRTASEDLPLPGVPEKPVIMATPEMVEGCSLVAVLVVYGYAEGSAWFSAPVCW
ncbi:MAG: hypothetical protein AB7V04_00505 [Desulfomonilaceae bacterium]